MTTSIHAFIFRKPVSQGKLFSLVSLKAARSSPGTRRQRHRMRQGHGSGCGVEVEWMADGRRVEWWSDRVAFVAK